MMSLPLYKELVQAEYDATWASGKATKGTLSWKCTCASVVLARLGANELAEVTLSWEASTKTKSDAWEAGNPMSSGGKSSETDM